MSWAMEKKGYSQRRACGLVGIDPRVYRYRSSRPDDAELRGRLRELAAERRRFGYRRLHLLLKREGIAVNWKKLYRLYREERLTVRKRGGRKRAVGTRAPMAIPQAPTSAGASISSPIRWSTAVASAFCASSTTSAGNAWQLSSTTRSRASEWRGSWTPSPNAAVSR